MRGASSAMQITPDPVQEINMDLEKLRHRTQVKLFNYTFNGVIFIVIVQFL